jgi:hypothetical protein
VLSMINVCPAQGVRARVSKKAYDAKALHSVGLPSCYRSSPALTTWHAVCGRQEQAALRQRGTAQGQLEPGAQQDAEIPAANCWQAHRRPVRAGHRAHRAVQPAGADAGAAAPASPVHLLLAAAVTVALDSRAPFLRLPRHGGTKLRLLYGAGPAQGYMCSGLQGYAAWPGAGVHALRVTGLRCAGPVQGYMFSGLQGYAALARCRGTCSARHSCARCRCSCATSPRTCSCACSRRAWSPPRAASWSASSCSGAPRSPSASTARTSAAWCAAGGPGCGACWPNVPLASRGQLRRTCSGSGLERAVQHYNAGRLCTLPGACQLTVRAGASCAQFLHCLR